MNRDPYLTRMIEGNADETASPQAPVGSLGTTNRASVENKKLMLLVRLKLLLRKEKRELDLERFVKDPEYAAFVLANASESKNEDLINAALQLLELSDRAAATEKATAEKASADGDKKYFRSLR